MREIHVAPSSLVYTDTQMHICDSVCFCSSVRELAGEHSVDHSPNVVNLPTLTLGLVGPLLDTA